jgi:hypothetical protein
MRRLTAMLGIIVIVGLALLLMWRVYLHHRSGSDDDEPGVIAAAKLICEVA